MARVLEKRLGALPVVAQFGRRLRIAEVVDELCPVRPVAPISHGEVIEALVANRLTAPAPLVQVEAWAAAMAVDETSDAVKLSSCVRKFPGGGGEGGGFVVVLAGGQAVVQAAEEAAEEVALGGGVPVAGGFAAVVVGAGAG